MQKVFKKLGQNVCFPLSFKLSIYHQNLLVKATKFSSC